MSDDFEDLIKRVFGVVEVVEVVGVVEVVITAPSQITSLVEVVRN